MGHFATRHTYRMAYETMLQKRAVVAHFTCYSKFGKCKAFHETCSINDNSNNNNNNVMPLTNNWAFIFHPWEERWLASVLTYAWDHGRKQLKLVPDSGQGPTCQLRVFLEQKGEKLHFPWRERAERCEHIDEEEEKQEEKEVTGSKVWL